MKRVGVALAVLALLASTAQAATMPWTTFGLGDNAMKDDVKKASMNMCPKGEVIVAVASKVEGEAFIMVYASDTGNIIFFFDGKANDPDAAPTEIGVGRLDPEKGDEIPKLLWLPYDPAFNACKFLFNEGA